MVVVAQLVRAPDCGSGGRRFETDLPPKIKAFQFSEGLLLFIIVSTMYSVYILYSEKLDSYYKGYTSNMDERFHRHNQGYEKFTSKGVPWKLILVIKKPTRSEAMLLERKLKNLNRLRLESFITKCQGSSQDNQQS